MHLGVNLRHAQVKAVFECGNCSDSDPQEQSITESDDEIELQKCGDIDLFVHEISKLFGHLGTPEYCHGASAFRVFLESKVRAVE